MDQELKILLLEDADDDAELIEYELGQLKFPFSLRRVATREAFQEALKEFSPDLILADNHLPAFDGLVALALAHEQCSQVPFLFISGAMIPKLAESGLSRGRRERPRSRAARTFTITPRLNLLC
jgi:CheY-like chemotaxis protein